MSCGSSGSRSSPINRAPSNKDMYWFAHCCEPLEELPNSIAMDPVKETKVSANNMCQQPMNKELACDINASQLVACRFMEPNQIIKKQSNHLDAYWFAQGGEESVVPILNNYSFEEFSGKDGIALLSQKEREEKIRQFREQQEEERRRRLYELQYATVQAKKYREQLEDERRRKIEDLRLRELERRQGVEERKRMIWEAEQERKEAILRRNLEREARIEARRNAQRNSMSFAFGSSTPRTFDLDLAALGPARTQNSVVFSATSNKRTDEKEIDSARRGSGVDGFDRKAEDITYFAEGVVEEAMNNQTQVANLELSPQASIENKNRMYIGMLSDVGGCVDVFEYNSSAGGPKRTSQYRPYSSGCLVGSGAVVGDDPMSRSMISLSSASRARRKTDLMPSLPRDHNTSRSRSPGNHGKRAMSMTRLDQLAQPRRKHTGVSTGTSNTNPVDGPCTTSPILSAKEALSRPRSSMSATSEQSVTSSQVSTTSVKMRSGPRRVRPVSMGGVPSNHTVTSNQSQSRQGRSTERKAITPTTRHYRAKSAEQSEKKQALPMIRKPTANQKTSKTSKPTNGIPAKDTDGADSPLTKTPDMSLSPEPDLLQISDRQSPEANEEIVVNDVTEESSPITKPRISSEEEAKAALAEKRKLAREQAEREAELERQRQEQLRREEEERKRQEEEAQRKFEEEQIRLAELHRLQEEEKLRKAIEEQEQREEEERERLEEETRQRIEKEEQERKAREEAEKQRKELEERLRREEAERAERKRRVEQIMSRTRKTPTNPSSQNNSKLSSPEDEHKPLPASSPETTADQLVEVKSDNDMLPSVQSSIPCKDVDAFVPVTKSSPTVNGQDHLQQDIKNWNPFSEPTYQQENNPFIDGNSHSAESTVKECGQQNLSTSECLLKASDSGVILADHSPDKVKTDNIPQPNGYNHHDEDRSFTDSMSPEEKSENSVGVLLDFGTISTPSPSQNFTQQIVSTEFDELINIGAGTTNQNEVNLLNNADEVNSNKVPGNPFIAFDEPITRKQDSSLADLLS